MKQAIPSLSCLIHFAAHVLCVVPILADGLPIDRETKEVHVPHTLIDLSPSQVEELETMNSVTFPPEQWAELRKISPSCPKQLEQIVLWTNRDCTCVLSNYTYGIVLESNRIALVHGKWSSYWLVQDIIGVFEEKPSELSMDREGNLYHGGSLISKELLLTGLAELPVNTKKREEPPFFCIRISVGMKRAEEPAKSTIDEIYEAARAAGWETASDDYYEFNGQ